MRSLLKLKLLALLFVVMPRVEVAQKPFMVWDHPCLGEIDTTKAYLEAPMNDIGQVDKSKALLRGVIVNYTVGCGRVEIRKVPVEVKE